MFCEEVSCGVVFHMSSRVLVCPRVLAAGRLTGAVMYFIVSSPFAACWFASCGEADEGVWIGEMREMGGSVPSPARGRRRLSGARLGYTCVGLYVYLEIHRWLTV